MTIDEAIKILNTVAQDSALGLYPDKRSAIELGIEALKRIQKMRQDNAFLSPPPLPGETEDL